MVPLRRFRASETDEIEYGQGLGGMVDKVILPSENQMMSIDNPKRSIHRGG